MATVDRSRRRLGRRGDTPAEDIMAHGRELALDGRWEEAMNVLYSRADADGMSPELYYYASLAAFHTEHFGPSMGMLRRFLDCPAPWVRHVQCAWLLGHVLRTHGLFDESLSIFRKIKNNFKPCDAISWLTLPMLDREIALAHLRLYKASEAIALIESRLSATDSHDLNAIHMLLTTLHEAVSNSATHPPYHEVAYGNALHHCRTMSSEALLAVADAMAAADCHDCARVVRSAAANTSVLQSFTPQWMHTSALALVPLVVLDDERPVRIEWLSRPPPPPTPPQEATNVPAVAAADTKIIFVSAPQGGAMMGGGRGGTGAMMGGHNSSGNGNGASESLGKKRKRTHTAPYSDDSVTLSPPPTSKRDNPATAWAWGQSQGTRVDAPRYLMTSTSESAIREAAELCMRAPLTILQGVPELFGMSLDAFSSSALAAGKAGSAVVEMRRQVATDEPRWRCTSQLMHRTLQEYKSYQQQMRTKEEGKRAHPMVSIDFATNIDLDDATWPLQNAELNKLPLFLRPGDAGGLLGHYKHKVLGLNSPQMYLKVAGCRTPGHQENNDLCSVNINTGPGDCLWYGLDIADARSMEALCIKYGQDYAVGSWWPDEDDLLHAGLNVVRCIQKPGEVVYVNVGCVHWVKALDVTNNVAYNMAPCDPVQYDAIVRKYYLNLHNEVQSVLPVVALSWRLLSDPSSPAMNDPRVLVRVLAFCSEWLEQEKHVWADVEARKLPYVMAAVEADEAPSLYCSKCQCEIYALAFTSTTQRTHDNEALPFCSKCAGKLRASTLMIAVRRLIVDMEETLDTASARLEELAAAAGVVTKKDAVKQESGAGGVLEGIVQQDQREEQPEQREERQQERQEGQP